MSKTSLFSRKVVGGVYSIYDESQTTGNIFWVNNATGTDAVGNGTHPDKCFASINFAVQQCTASNGDRIYALPGHVESVVGASGLVCNVAGVSIIGIGNRNSRPQLSLANTNSTINVSAASVSFRNLVVAAVTDETVVGFLIGAAFCELDRVDFVETTSVQLISFLITNTAGTDLRMIGCNHRQATAPAATGIWINLAGGSRAHVDGNRFAMAMANNANSTVIGTQTAAVDLLITNNLIVLSTAATLPVPINLNHANITGLVDGNRVASGITAIAGSIALTGAYSGQNYSTHTANKSGLLEPPVDT